MFLKGLGFKRRMECGLPFWTSLENGADTFNDGKSLHDQNYGRVISAFSSGECRKINIHPPASLNQISDLWTDQHMWN